MREFQLESLGAEDRIDLAGIPLCLARPQNPPADGIGLTTASRLKEPGWWPTKGEPSRGEYSGSAACARCHQKIALLQKSIPMYHASMPALQSDLLVGHLPLRFQEGTFSTSITTSPEEMTFSVTDGVNTNSVPAVWAFGSKNGQTYILEKDGGYFESRLSFFEKLSRWTSLQGSPPNCRVAWKLRWGGSWTSIQRRAASGVIQPRPSLRICSNRRKLQRGLREACHGPGAAHVASMTANDPERGDGDHESCRSVPFQLCRLLRCLSHRMG